MARRSYAGAAAALTLASGINATDLTITTSGTATGWPSGSGGKFLAVIARGTASEEKIYVTSRAGNVLTVASTGDRGVDGTGAASHAAGVAVEHCVGAVDLDEPNDHLFTTTRDDHTQYLNTTRHDVTARHSYGAALGTRPTPVDTGDANAAGSASAPAAGDHVHKGVVANDAWTTFVPTLTQLGAVTKTVTYAAYQRTGRMITAQVVLACTGSGTVDNNIVIGLPIAGNFLANSPIGSGLIFDTSAASYAAGTATYDSANGVTIMGSGYHASSSIRFGRTGGDFGIALAAGDLVMYTVTYEAAS